MKKAVFESKYKDQFANARNLIAGTINRLSINDVIKDIDFVAYEVIMPSLKPSAQMKYLKDNDFICVRNQTHKNISNEEVDLEKSLKFITLPRLIGIFPETKAEIIASIGPYGPYLKHDKRFVSLKEDDVTEIGINRAIELIQKNIDLNREIVIGTHPESKKEILQKKGIKGRPDYLSYKKKNYSIPKDFSDKKVSLEIALEIIEKGGRGKKS